MNKSVAVFLLLFSLASVVAFPQGVTVPIDFVDGTRLAQRAQDVTRYVDPAIGSEGLGRVFIGPSMPYAMIKPGPDAVSMPNAGWAPMPEPIKGFSQVHVSGTGGGQKYGNILIMPYDAKYNEHGPASAERSAETFKLSYYAAMLASGDYKPNDPSSAKQFIEVEVTSAPKAAIYRLTYPADALPALKFDAGAFLGMSDIPDQRETQQLVGSQIEVVNDSVVRGYNRVRGGWNNGRAYTVYFYAVCSKPFVRVQTAKGVQPGARSTGFFAKQSDFVDDQPVSSQSEPQAVSFSQSRTQTDTHAPTSAMVYFSPDDQAIDVKIGISFISELKARDNLYADIPDWDFDGVHNRALGSWQDLLSRITISPSATEQQKRMFYTALYHTMIMPVDRSGENPLWADDSPYYDDYYAIWDTYRTSTPLITLIDPQREVDIVNSLLNIYRRDGYMPDARSGNSNGRTQGGSNAEIVIADAFVKGLQGIDYNLALEAMLKDAEVPPGGIEEAEGRGGLREYIELGYVPFGIPRAGNRTVEYAFCDYAIAQVAKGLGKADIHDRYMRLSGNWRNLWRSDYEFASQGPGGGASSPRQTITRGFIMPRDRDGNWLDSLPQGHSKVTVPKYEYTAMTFEGPWYTPWWSMFFYEAPSWEYSLSIPHDVPGLIEICGGPEEFERRLDTFFDQGYYNVNNEPSFLSPCLYHWIGKPWRSSDRIRQIIADNYSNTPMGLPGNDDSGAMSSWLAFHMMGLYPNAGHDYYLINTPLIERIDIQLPGAKDIENSRKLSKTFENSRSGATGLTTFTIVADGLSYSNRYIQSATLNGHPYPYSTIRHADILAGGTLRLQMGPKPSSWGNEPWSRSTGFIAEQDDYADDQPVSQSGSVDDWPVAEPLRDSVENFREYSKPLENFRCPVSFLDEGGQFAKLLFVFKLHGQTRRYNVSFDFLDDGAIMLTWGIERNLKWQQGTYLMLPEAVASASMLDLSMPMDGAEVTLPSGYTAYIISRDALARLKSTGQMEYNGFAYTLCGDADGVLHVMDSVEGSQMWILDDERLPLILKMADNPLEVDWTVKFLD